MELRLKVRDLLPLHSPTVSGDRPRLRALSDDELIDACERPTNGDPIRVNAVSGRVVDGNGRAYETEATGRGGGGYNHRRDGDRLRGIRAGPLDVSRPGVNAMTDRDAIYRILFDALVELREHGAESKNAKVFHLANLVHQLPNRIKDLEEWKADAGDVLRELRERAREGGIDRWLEGRVPDADPAATTRAD